MGARPRADWSGSMGLWLLAPEGRRCYRIRMNPALFSVLLTILPAQAATVRGPSVVGPAASAAGPIAPGAPAVEIPGLPGSVAAPAAEASPEARIEQTVQAAAAAIAPAAASAAPKGGGVEGGAAALGSFYDSPNKKDRRGVPAEWVDAMIGDGRNVEPATARLRYAVQRLGFRNVALNREILQKHSDKYTVEIPMGTITDQKQSGRCWIFGALNMIRSMLIADNKVPEDFEFSQNHLHFFNMLEKSNSKIESMADKLYRRRSKHEKFSAADRRMAVTPDIGDGGWTEWLLFLVNKYGLVPKSAMGETISSGNTATLLSELDDSLAATGMELLRNAKDYKARRAENLSEQIKSKGMERIWRILVTHLGAPPQTFEYRQTEKPKKDGRKRVTPTKITTYTPQSYAKDFVCFDAGDWVHVGAYPGKKTGTVYVIPKTAIGAAEPGANKFDLRFLNTTPDRMLEITKAAIDGGQPVPFAADISKDVDLKTGIMHPKLFDREGVYQTPSDERSPKLSRKEKAYTSRVGANHEMMIGGYDQPDPNGPIVKLKNENSWSDEYGMEGVFHLYVEWWRENVFDVLVHKKWLAPRELELWNGKAKVIRDTSTWY